MIKLPRDLITARKRNTSLLHKDTEYNLSFLSTDRICCPKKAPVIKMMTCCWIWWDPVNSWSKLVYHPAYTGRHGSFFSTTRRSTQRVQIQAFMSFLTAESGTVLKTSHERLCCSNESPCILTLALQ